MIPLLLIPALSSVFSLAEGYTRIDVQYELNIEPSAPDKAVTVPPDFFSFGFETAFLDKFANGFSQNISKSLSDRMSVPPIFRIGGTSGDLVRYDPKQKNTTHCIGGPACPHSSQDTFSLGPEYFKSFDWFQNVNMVIQAPISPNPSEKDWLDRSMDYVREATKKLGKEGIAGIALGNEPNWYHYDMETYMSRCLELEEAIVKELGLEDDEQRIFQLGEIPDEMLPRKRSYKYSLTDLLKKGINRNGRAKFAAQHFYQVHLKKDEREPDMQTSLMSHNAIKQRFPPIDSAIKYINDHEKDLSYVISETGTAIGNANSSFAGAFGAALWAVDFHLYAMTRGVKRVSNTMRPESTHSYWIPIDPFPEKPDALKKTKGPSVQGMFPSAPFIVDFIGKQSSKVVEIDVPGTPDYLTAYAMYNEESGAMERLALVNLLYWTPDSPLDRGNAILTWDVKGKIKPTTVQRMHADNGAAAVGFDNGDSTDNVTWAGEQWTWKVDRGVGHFPHGEEHEPVKISDGKATVVVPDSEAVIVTFE